MNACSIKRVRAAIPLALVACGLLVVDQPGMAQQTPERPAPTQAEIRYGPHDRNVLDFWQAEVDEPRPLAIFIHGGGFRGGDKSSLSGHKIKKFLDSGISVAALRYRLLEQAVLPAAHHDCRRAIQFLRTQAAEWNLDAERFGAFGGSAGAQICMYLAFHDDMANPNSKSPLERQSTRLQCLATSGGQTTMDFKWWFKHIPGYDRPHRPATEYFGELSDQDRGRVIHDISALSLLTADDPPIYMQHNMAPNADEPKDPGRIQGWRVHHVNFGVTLLSKAKELGVPSYLKYPGADVRFKNDVEFLCEHLLDRSAKETSSR